MEVWAALRALGRSGLAELIERCCRHATRFAEGLTAAGYTVLNDVVLNQVMVAFGDDATTQRRLRCNRRAPAGVAARFGTGAPPCASVSHRGRRQTKMWNVVWWPSSAQLVNA
ncbi:MAG: hypothetical protein R2932_36885 [Caldilineaceae bacterium]